MRNILAEICEHKREHIRRCKAERKESALVAEIPHVAPPRGFIRALSAALLEGRFALIAEIKKASPSKGIIRADFSPPHLAEAYAKGGASCLSVLTDEPYFQGKDAFLQAARDAVSLPALRKDFMLEPYQIVESRVLGADCILLIMACLSDAQYAELYAAATGLGMDVLVEVHDERELDRALTVASPRMVGINNRNLKTFITDLGLSERLARYIPGDVVKIAESGIETHQDLQRLQKSGISGFLVGESLMRERDVAAATERLLTGGKA